MDQFLKNTFFLGSFGGPRWRSCKVIYLLHWWSYSFCKSGSSLLYRSTLTWKEISFCFRFFHASDKRNDLHFAPNSRLLPFAWKPTKSRRFCRLNAHLNIALFLLSGFGLHPEPRAWWFPRVKIRVQIATIDTPKNVSQHLEYDLISKVVEIN